MLSWIASCCQGKPKKGPMGEAAGVTNCRPAMLPRRKGARLLQVSTLSHFIILGFLQVSWQSRRGNGYCWTAADSRNNRLFRQIRSAGALRIHISPRREARAAKQRLFRGTLQRNPKFYQSYLQEMTETVCTRKESIIPGTVKDPLQHLGDLTGPGGAQRTAANSDRMVAVIKVKSMLFDTKREQQTHPTND